MAVTKIRKLSSWTLLAFMAISVVVLLAFFLGGSVMEGAHKIYNFTDGLLYWTYAIFFITAIAAIIFALTGLIKSFQTNAKKALLSVGSVVLLAVVMIISYAIGGTNPLELNSDSAVYNTPEMLKLTDMWLFTIYIMGALVLLSIVWGAVRKAFNR
ncbi:hypothetical protein HQ45_02210 [Porphyromonas crevioricanis]|uniref:Uncharacterized protein n=2 Tax=Porphyromonas crevioricanis TaxID=393921 RepID=A0A0A2FXX5_9PORP|nr:hypothetical protein [Porphyromonas crevioricanis]KGN90951.1 hypothetical protein HQ45_02210 [Porphyromonas crevioricanis]KGN95047.1 hypothetical protein HQ38_04465 [Porphyromonas crevioricanis]SJZ54195.1 hypothetical protein SAMN02745203_00080 [Porphyromonas crevioricanis]SQH73276.1 Uncharacterised protein [Porphyromonas crevioricanis]GAD06260.1 hypothetical protein PORCRE_1984 [Porphyromonas crevioricanis JCM 15906]